MKEYSAFKNLKCTYSNHKVTVECYKTGRFKEHNEQMKLYIYRQECNDFTFNIDYEEYKYSLSFEDASLIYEGILQEDSKKIYYKYEDTDIIEGNTYAYYVKSEFNDIVCGPYMVKARSSELWLSYDAIDTKLNELKNKYDELVTIKTHGYSIENRAIKSITVGNNENIKLSFIGLIHAGEAGPELLLYTIEQLLIHNSDLLEKVGVSFLLNANPDMRERLVKGVPWYLRKNANGVDLNRNFDCEWDIVEYGYGLQTDVQSSATYRGPYPVSEPETKAVLDFYQYSKAEAFFIFHCLSSICTDSFLVSKYAKDDKAFIKQCMKFLKPYTKGFGTKDEVSLYYGTSYGSFPHYLYKKYHIPAFDMELGEVSDEVKDMVIHDYVSKELMDEYKSRHYKGISEVLKTCI